jgi:hypothetical protein
MHGEKGRVDPSRDAQRPSRLTDGLEPYCIYENSASAFSSSPLFPAQSCFKRLKRPLRYSRLYDSYNISFIPLIHLCSSRYQYLSISYVDEYHIVKLLKWDSANLSGTHCHQCIIVGMSLPVFRVLYRLVSFGAVFRDIIAEGNNVHLRPHSFGLTLIR